MTDDNGVSITDVKTVKQVVGDQLANDMIAQGWVLLDTYKIGVPSDSGPSQMVGYVLGWVKDSQPPSN